MTREVYALRVLLKIDGGDSLKSIFTYFNVVFENEFEVILAHEKVFYAKIFCDYLLLIIISII